MKALGLTTLGIAGVARIADVARVAALCCLALLLCAPAALAQDAAPGLSGGYRGIDNADGWRLLLAPVQVDERPAFDGLFIDESGQSTGFVAFGDESGAEAQVAFSNAEAFFRIEPRPIGLVLSWIPVDASGKLAVEAAQNFPFVRDDVVVPEQPDGLASPPSEVTSSFNSIAFVKSYEFWTPEETGRAYASLTDQSRTLIKIYSVVHTDLLWKLCQARTTPPGLAEALEGQAIDCPTLLGRMADIQQRGIFGQYKNALAPERSALLDALRCATGALRPRELCVEISRGTSQRALSLETAASIIERY